MPAILIILSLAFAWLASPFPARAAERIYEPPKVEYSAERFVRRGGRQQSMQVHYAPGRERMNLLGSAAAGNSLIQRHDLGQTFVVMPMMRAYGVAPPDLGGELDAILRSLRMSPEGRETVGGIPTLRYRVDGRLKGTIWLDERNIPVRIQGRSEIDGDWQETLIEQQAIRVGRQDPALFDIPAGLRRIDLSDPTWGALARRLLYGG